jgi:hypothetical protein
MSEWINVDEQLPPASHGVFYFAYLADEHMRTTNRLHPYDVVSGWYISSFPKLYTHWQSLPAPPTR